MHKFPCLMVTLFVLTMTLNGFAASDMPDLKGTWVTQTHTIRLHRPQAPPSKSHSDVKTGLVTVAVTLTIDKQDGFRFSGNTASAKRTEKIAGVIGFDQKSLYIVDEDGMILGKLVSPDKINYVYLRVTKDQSVAARGTLLRKR